MAIKSATTLKLLTAAAAIEDLVDVSLSSSKTTIDITSKDSSYVRDLLVGTESYTITANAFVDYAASNGFTEILTSFQGQAAIAWEISTDVTGDLSLSGSGFVTSVDYNGALDDAMRYTFTIEVTGDVTQTTEA